MSPLRPHHLSLVHFWARSEGHDVERVSTGIKNQTSIFGTPQSTTLIPLRLKTNSIFSVDTHIWTTQSISRRHVSHTPNALVQQPHISFTVFSLQTSKSLNGGIYESARRAHDTHKYQGQTYEHDGHNRSLCRGV
jgi:hypothetical protein